MRTNKSTISSFLIVCLAIMACNLPSGLSGETPTSTFTPVALGSETPTLTPTPTATQCSPIVTTNTDANVRNGPGTVYSIAGQIPVGGTAPVAGRNAEGTWWYRICRRQWRLWMDRGQRHHRDLHPRNAPCCRRASHAGHSTHEHQRTPAHPHTHTVGYTCANGHADILFPAVPHHHHTLSFLLRNDGLDDKAFLKVSRTA